MKHKGYSLWNNDNKRNELRSIISNLSYMGLTDREKNKYCTLAIRHIGLNNSMIHFNCLHCGVKKCRVRREVKSLPF